MCIRDRSSVINEIFNLINSAPKPKRMDVGSSVENSPPVLSSPEYSLNLSFDIAPVVIVSSKFTKERLNTWLLQFIFPRSCNSTPNLYLLLAVLIKTVWKPKLTPIPNPDEGEKKLVVKLLNSSDRLKLSGWEAENLNPPRIL